MRDELIRLITKTGITEDESGFPIDEREDETEIWARVKSVRSTEFYQAYTEGMELKYVFCVDRDDLALANRTDTKGRTIKPWAVEYDGVRYRIVRQYMTDMGEVELSAEEADHGHDY